MEEFKYFEFEGIRIDYTSLLGLLIKNEFTKQYKDFIIQNRETSYILIHNQKYVCIYKNPIKININSESFIKSFFIYSNLDIEKYCTRYGIDVKNIYLEDGTPFKKVGAITPLYQGEITLKYKNKEELSHINKKPILEMNKTYKVIDYSKYYKDYFGYDLESNTEFKYLNNDIRKKIFDNLNILWNSNCKKFKFTGPFNIGKSLTLLQFSRVNEDVFYFNLKVLLNKQERDCYIILLEEFSRINEYYFNSIQNIIKSNYLKGTNPIDLLYQIMGYLSNSLAIFIFIFDQYKDSSFSTELKENLNNLSNKIKIVYCSSINNSNIQRECIKTWNKFVTNPQRLTLENQEYYFYYKEIYPQQYNANEPIIEQIQTIKRFNKYFTQNDSDEEKISKINAHINKKIKEFSELNDVSLDLVLMNIKSTISKKYELEKIESVMKYCPLKYFVVEFMFNQLFMIKLQFPFLKPIINRRLLKDEVFNYFKDEKYLKILIENETVKGNYFEEAVKFGLKEDI